MKIVHITTTLMNGGAEAALFRLVESNTENTHVIISLTGTGIYEKKFMKLGVRVFCLQFKGVGFPLNAIILMRRILKSESPDIVQTWMYHPNLIGGLVARSAGIRSVYWNLRTSNPQLGDRGRTTQWLNIVSAKLSRIVPFEIVSCAHRATDAHVAIGYPAEKIQTICNGYNFASLDYSKESRVKFRSVFNVTEEQFLIGIVARWHPQKDHDLLFNALSSIKEFISQPWKLILVGPEMIVDNEELVYLVKKYDLEEFCIFAGPQDNIPTVMSALDLHVLTSTDEGFPNVVVEAMACSTPCVSTDAGDAARIIGRFGWVGPTRDVENLKINLRKAFDMFSDSSKWKKLKRDVRERARNEYSMTKMVRLYQMAWSRSMNTKN